MTFDDLFEMLLAAACFVAFAATLAHARRKKEWIVHGVAIVCALVLTGYYLSRGFNADPFAAVGDLHFSLGQIALELDPHLFAFRVALFGMVLAKAVILYNGDLVTSRAARWIHRFSRSSRSSPSSP